MLLMRMRLGTDCGFAVLVSLLAPTSKHLCSSRSSRWSYVGNRKDTAEALDFYRRGLIKAPFKTVGLSELQKVYDMMHEGKIAGRYVVDTSK